MKESRVVAERHELQANILKLYKDTVALAQKELCGRCKRYEAHFITNLPVCNVDLLPITSYGEQCPYFDQR